MTQATVLLADDDNALRTVLNKALAIDGYKVRATSNATTLWKWISEGEGDIVVTDVVMPDENAFELLPRIKQLRPDLPVIVMSAQNTVLTAITATERGAYEYLPKPFDLNELTGLVKRALQPTAPAKAPLKRRPSGGAFTAEGLPIIGRSAAMQEVYRIIARLTATDLTVMISGESGTGKELVARVLHDYGKRRDKPFVAVNMAAIPRDLIESELFGQDANMTANGQSTKGRFEQAYGGTLFLDEIGDMPFEAQTRLLRVLQEGEYTTIGGANPVKTDVRIIAATNKNLPALIEKGLFREDLFFRLNVVPLRLPPLRERLEDVPDLTRHFLAKMPSDGLPTKSIQQAALDQLMEYNWPGNARELENVIRRISAIYSDEIITKEIVREQLSSPKAHDSDGNEEEQSLEQKISGHLDDYFADYPGNLPPDGIYDRVLKDFERPLIEKCLDATRGNQLKAAALLGLNRNTLRKKIRDLEIDVVRSAKVM